MATIETQPTDRIRPLRSRYRVELLSQDDVERIVDACFTVLERVGLQIDSEPVLRDLAEAGAHVDLETERVRFPRSMVEAALDAMPRDFEMAARDPSCDLVIDGSAGYLSLDGTPAFILDIDTHERRPPNREDYRQAMVLSDALPEIAYTWPPFALADVHPSAQSVWQAYLELACTTKHAQPNEVITPGDARAAIAMARAVAGGADELRARPLISSYQCAISPLSYDGAAVEAALEFAKAGVPAGWVSMAVATAAAPTTLAGHLVSVHAELLGGIAVLETLVPGAATFYGPYQAFMDLRSGDMNPAWGGEDVLFKLASAQIARRLGLRMNIMGYGTGAKTADWQAGVQHALSLMGVVLAGSGELIASAGTLHGSRVFSHEQLVLDAELFGMVCHMLEGFTVTEDDLALEVIEAAGPAGHFLDSPHTLAHMRERWMSELFGTGDWDTWVASGRPEPKDRARERARELLATHEPEPLPEDLDAELRSIVAAREAEILAGGEPS
jgi:trimethylamine--corrinoid protein Co-methyltransferase